MNPQPEQIHIDDLAECLSRECRWSGSIAISVAEHSCLLAEIASPDMKIYALLHDAAEAYTGDIPSPIKKLLTIDASLAWVDEVNISFTQMEERILECICRSLDVPFDQSKFERILKIESEIFDQEIKLYVNRTMRSSYWQTRWKKEVLNAIRLLNVPN